MGKILGRKILTEDTYTSISVDKETHDYVVIKNRGNIQ